MLRIASHVLVSVCEAFNTRTIFLPSRDVNGRLIIEQAHRFIRRRWRACQRSRTFHTAERTPEGIESMRMTSKGQVKRLDGRDAVGQMKVIESLWIIMNLVEAIQCMLSYESVLKNYGRPFLNLRLLLGIESLSKQRLEKA